MHVARCRTMPTLLTPLLFSLFLLLGWQGAWAQYTLRQDDQEIDTSLSGDWRGTVIASNGSRYQLLLHISAVVNGPCSVSYDMAFENSYNRHMTSNSCEHQRLLFVNDSVNASFEGRLDRSNGTIEGVWEQARTRTAIRLYRVRPIVRSQEPETNELFLTRTVTVVNRSLGVRLGGTLTAPNDQEKHPLVILVSDAGQQDRDATDQTGHRPFLVIAHEMARRSVATLRLDDRGVGASAGAPQGSIMDQALDVLASIDRATAEPFIDPERIFVVGHGVGGIVAAQAASLDKRIKGIVLAATPALDGKTWMLAQARATDELHGVDPEITKAAVEMLGAWYDALDLLIDHQVMSQRIAHITDSLLAVHDELMTAYPVAVRLRRPDRLHYISSTLLPWLRSYKQLDAVQTLTGLDVPTLCLLADRDLVVPHAVNEPAWQTMFEVMPKLEMTVFNNMNHGFQPCNACTEEEATHTETTVSPAFLQSIATWIETITEPE
jgi:uncharacterized protein